MRAGPRSVARRVIGRSAPSAPRPGSCQGRTPARRAEHVEVDALRRGRARGGRRATASRTPVRAERGAAATAGAASANSPRARRTSKASSARSSGEACSRARSRLADAEARALLRRQVDPVEPRVLAHVADEVRELEGEPEPAVARVVARRDAEQRRHDAPDGAGGAVHVGLELLPGRDPHRRAVDAHRAHVGPQLAERQAVAPPGVDERADDRVGRAAGGEAARRARASQASSAARRACGLGWPARPVDDLVGRAHVAVEGVRGGADSPGSLRVAQ